MNLEDDPNYLHLDILTKQLRWEKAFMVAYRQGKADAKYGYRAPSDPDLPHSLRFTHDIEFWGYEVGQRAMAVGHLLSRY